MMILTYAVAGVFLAIAFLNLLMKVFGGFDNPAKLLTDNDLPDIAVLVAARNEENNIERCLRSLIEQNYPKEKITILVGNDQSADRTAAIVDAFAGKVPNIRQVHIITQLGKAKGKANVLAQLAHQTQAAYFLITDADIEVKPDWARTLVSFFQPGTGIVSGTTVVRGSTFFAGMQKIDWLYFMGLLLSFDKMGMASTAVGNNMAVKREAYFSTGGYENFEFSVTEDYKLFQEVRKKGWKTINMCNRQSVNFSAAAPDFKTLINQRKRWLTGAKELPFYWWLIFAVYGSFIPLLIALAFVNLKLALMLYFFKLIVQSLTIIFQLKALNLKLNLFHLLCYEAYTIVITLCTAFYFILPVKLNWKNRYY